MPKCPIGAKLIYLEKIPLGPPTSFPVHGTPGRFTDGDNASPSVRRQVTLEPTSPLCGARSIYAAKPGRGMWHVVAGRNVGNPARLNAGSRTLRTCDGALGVRDPRGGPRLGARRTVRTRELRPYSAPMHFGDWGLPHPGVVAGPIPGETPARVDGRNSEGDLFIQPVPDGHDDFGHGRRFRIRRTTCNGLDNIVVEDVMSRGGKDLDAAHTPIFNDDKGNLYRTRPSHPAGERRVRQSVHYGVTDRRKVRLHVARLCPFRPAPWPGE